MASNVRRVTNIPKLIDIAVVGAGPAGLMAATVAGSAGASVSLFETNSWPGGRLGIQTQPLQGLRSIYQDANGVGFCAGLLDDAGRLGANLFFRTSVSEIRRLPIESTSFELTCVPDGKAPENVQAKAIILATGSWEPRTNFAGSDMNGVVLSGDAQTMLNVHGNLIGKRVLMAGSDNAGLLISANLIDAGAHVLAVVDESPRVIGREFNTAPLRDAGVEILTSTKIIEAVGNDRVEQVVVASTDTSTTRTFEVDTVCLAGARTPESRLASMLDVPLCHEEIFGGPTPVHNRSMETNISGVYVCGDSSGVENGAVSLECGRLAGISASASLGYRHPDAERQIRLARARLGYLRRGRRGAMRREAKARLAMSISKDTMIKSTLVR